MLKRNNLLGLLIFGCCFIFAGCCKDSMEEFLDFAIEVTDVEGCDADILTDEKWFINAGLYNDEISDSVLRTRDDMCKLCIIVYEGDFKNETYPGVNLEIERKALENGTGKFYCLINDPNLKNYLSDYETVRIDYISNNYESKFSLNKKSD